MDSQHEFDAADRHKLRCRDEKEILKKCSEHRVFNSSPSGAPTASVISSLISNVIPGVWKQQDVSILQKNALTVLASKSSLITRVRRLSPVSMDAFDEFAWTDLTFC